MASKKSTRKSAPQKRASKKRASKKVSIKKKSPAAARPLKGTRRQPAALQRRRGVSPKAKGRVQAPRHSQAWYLNLGAEKARETYGTHRDFKLARIQVQSAAKREQRAFFARDIKKVRKLFKGFDAADGYSVTNFDKLSAAQYNTFRKYATAANYITTESVVFVKPRNKKQAESLAKHTGQRMPRQRRFAVHVEDPTLDRPKLTRDGRVQIVRRLKGVELIQQDYIFEELFSPAEYDGEYREDGEPVAKQFRAYEKQEARKESLVEKIPPGDWDEVIALSKGALPYLPDGNFVLLSLPHGPIGVPMAKADIVLNIQQYRQMYDNKSHANFQELIIGFRQMSHNIKSASAEMYALRNKRILAREQRQRENRILRQAARRKKRR